MAWDAGADAPRPGRRAPVAHAGRADHPGAGRGGRSDPAAAAGGGGLRLRRPDGVAAGRVSPLNIPAWRAFPLRDRLATASAACPLRVHNDAICLAAGEHWRGAGRGTANMLGMVVSTGVGGGLIWTAGWSAARPATPGTSGTWSSTRTGRRAAAAGAAAWRRSPAAPRWRPGPRSRAGGPARPRRPPPRTWPPTRRRATRSAWPRCAGRAGRSASRSPPPTHLCDLEVVADRRRAVPGRAAAVRPAGGGAARARRARVRPRTCGSCPPRWARAPA